MKRLYIKFFLILTINFNITILRAEETNFKIFQIGFNKCATTTLADFFNANGIPSIHWDNGDLAYSMYVNHFLNFPLLDKYYEEKYIGFFDMNSIRQLMPLEIGVMYFKKLDRQYPGSKFILNIRDKEAWLKSRINHATKYEVSLLQYYAFLYGVTTTKMLQIWSDLYDKHHADVLAYFENRPQDLLVFDIDNDSPQKIADFFAPYFKLDPSKYGHSNKTPVKKKRGFAFFNKIYCINLSQSSDRRAHMEAEFKRIGVDNYTFIEATDKDAAVTQAMLKSFKVKKYPGCFQCGKLQCACANNVLTSTQIGNLCVNHRG